jgi:hypothetical protein
MGERCEKTNSLFYMFSTNFYSDLFCKVTFFYIALNKVSPDLNTGKTDLCNCNNQDNILIMISTFERLLEFFVTKIF